MDRVRLLKDVDLYEAKGIPIKCYKNEEPIFIKVIPVIEDTEQEALVEHTLLNKFYNELVVTNQCPNFPLYHGALLQVPNDAPCFSKHTIKHYDLIDRLFYTRGYSHILVTEFIRAGDFDEWYDENERKLAKRIDWWKSIIFQTMFALDVLQRKYKFVHYDCHPGNVLIDQKDHKFTHMHYVFEKQHYYPLSEPGVVKLWDFEFARTFDDACLLENTYGSEQFDPYVDAHRFLTGLLLVQCPEPVESFIRSLYKDELIPALQDNISSDGSASGSESSESGSESGSERESSERGSESESESESESGSDDEYITDSEDDEENDSTEYLKNGQLKPDACKSFSLPTPKDILKHAFFDSLKIKPAKHAKLSKQFALK